MPMFKSTSSVAAIFLVAVGIFNPILVFADDDDDDDYTPPALPECSGATVQMEMGHSACFVLNGEVKSTTGYAADRGSFGDTAAWVQFGVNEFTSLGTVAFVVKAEHHTDEIWLRVGNGNTTRMPVPASIGITQSYFMLKRDNFLAVAGIVGNSVGNFSDDKPLNFLETFLSTDNATSGDGLGVDYDWDSLGVGGGALQLFMPFSNGLSVGVGLENIGGPSYEKRKKSGCLFQSDDSVDYNYFAYASYRSSRENACKGNGTLVSSVSYAGENVTGHVTALAGGILDSAIEDWAVHAGITATMDNFEARAAGVYDDDAFGVSGFLEGMLSAKATFDMFTLAATVDGDNAGTTAGSNQVGFGVSGSAAVTDGVKVNLGFRWHDNDTSTSDSEVWQAEAQIVADVTDTITLTGALGVYGETVTDSSTVYGKGEVAWNPGGGFETSFGGTYWSNGAYKTVFKASKSF